MCLIAVKRKGYKIPIYNHMWNACENNHDGIGIALYKENKKTVCIKKDFKDFDNFYSYIKKNVEIKDILIVHFRFATSGLIDNGNCHPFPITRNKQKLRKTVCKTDYAVAHNGVLSDYTPAINSKFSDTQKFVLKLLVDLRGQFTNKAVKRLITDHIKGDRLAILQSNGELILMGEYNESKGILYSNYGYSYNKYSYKKQKTYKTNNKKNQKRNSNKYKGNFPKEKYPTIEYDKNYYCSNFCEGCEKFKDSNWNEEFSGFICEECEKEMRFYKSSTDSDIECKFNNSIDEEIKKLAIDIDEVKSHKRNYTSSRYNGIYASDEAIF